MRWAGPAAHASGSCPLEDSRSETAYADRTTTLLQIRIPGGIGLRGKFKTNKENQCLRPTNFPNLPPTVKIAAASRRGPRTSEAGFKFF
jgi:hypothetical protein